METSRSLSAPDSEPLTPRQPSTFEAWSKFNPDVDAKVPLRRDPLALVIRFLSLTWALLTSGHPGDLFLWLYTMLRRRKPLSYPVPWLTFDAIRALRAAIPRAAVVFEFGAGNSTVFWARRAALVVSVEDNVHWTDMLRAKLASLKIDNAELIYTCEKDAYVHAIDSWPNEHFDMVVVDGAWRRECIAAAVRHVKKGGVLVVDNTDWHWFTTDPISGIPPTWRRRIYSGYAPMIGYRSETTVYTRVD